MILDTNSSSNDTADLSRVCGDDPDVKCLKAGIEKICPAYAGMILNLRLIKLIPSYLSRVCGDDPQS